MNSLAQPTIQAKKHKHSSLPAPTYSTYTRTIFISGTFSSNCRLTNGPHAHSGVIVGRVEQQRLAKKPNRSKRGKKLQSGCPPVTITDGAVMRPERYLLADRQGPQFGLEFYGDRNRFTSPIRERVVMLRTGWVYRVACYVGRAG